MTKAQFISAQKTLEAKGYTSLGAAMTTNPQMSGVHYINHSTGEQFLLNQFTFKEV